MAVPSELARRLTGRLRYLLLWLPLLFLALFFFYPLVNILRLTLTGEAIIELFTRATFLQVIWFTFWQATLSTVLTLLLGLPAAYLFARYDFAGKALLRALVTVPFVLPTVVVATAFRTLFGQAGPINSFVVDLFGLSQAPLRLEQSLTIILLAHIYYNVAVVIRLVGGFWANLDRRLNEAARVLGATPSRAFFEVTFPLLRPALLSASVLIFLFTFTSFGVILLLGGPRFNTIETEIYRQYVTFLNPQIAAALSVIQIAITFSLMSIYSRWQRRTTVPIDFRPQKSTLHRPQRLSRKITVWAMVIGLSVFMLTPLLILIGRSLMSREGQLTLAYYQALPVARRGAVTFVPPLVAVRNSLGYGLLTMLVAGSLGLFSAVMLSRPSRWRQWLDPLFLLPLGASAVTLGFGYVVTFDRLRTSPWLVLIAHTLVALPFVVRSLLPVLQGIKPNLREAAAVLGASPLRAWREVDLPIVGRALLVAAVFAFTISMGEFGATSFIVRPNSGFLTMPIAIQRYLSQPGALNFGQALAMSTILMAVCTAGFVAIERFRYADIGEF
ncbi:MAG: ABC transporter permease [Candidatus Promineifilaceae bacterium]